MFWTLIIKVFLRPSVLVRSVAFLATEHNEMFLGYQPGQVVEQGKNQCFEDYLCPRPQGADMDMVGKNKSVLFIPF
jgi:hypothetical protein